MKEGETVIYKGNRAVFMGLCEDGLAMLSIERWSRGWPLCRLVVFVEPRRLHRLVK